VFYIDKENKLKQVIYTNSTTVWEEGPLNSLNLTVYDSPGTVRFGACWKGSFDGDLDFPGTPTTPLEYRRAITLWVAIDESTFEQWVWFNERPESWFPVIDKWQGKNVHAGVGCYSWDTSNTTYTMMVSKDNYAEFYWKDTTSSYTPTREHPIGQWRNATGVTIPQVYPSTSLGWLTYFYVQMADRSIRGYNITFAAENTTIVDEDTFFVSGPSGPIKGIGGTHLLTFTLRNSSEDRYEGLFVLYQTEGDDITVFTRSLAGGEFSNSKLPIPDN